MPSNPERSGATRAALCAATRSLLLGKGLAGTTTAEVLEQTGLSKGAMYHHFRSMTELLEAVYREESHGAVMRAASSVSSARAPVERLKQACHLWLKELDRPEVGKLVLEIGPAALGMKRVREIEDGLTIPLFVETLEEAQALGEVSLADIPLAARLINGMVAEIAAQPRKSRTVAAMTIDPIVDAILGTLSRPA